MGEQEGDNNMNVQDLINDMIQQGVPFPEGCVNLSELDYSVGAEDTSVDFQYNQSGIRVNLEAVVTVENDAGELDGYRVYASVQNGKAEFTGVEEEF